MRTHAQIIDAVPGGARGLHERLGEGIHTVRSWRQRDSIPGDRWAEVVETGVTTLEELAQAAAAKNAPAEALRRARAA